MHTGQVEAQLEDVQPLIDAARAAVGGIKTDHINEVGHSHISISLFVYGSVTSVYLNFYQLFGTAIKPLFLLPSPCTSRQHKLNANVVAPTAACSAQRISQARGNGQC